MSIADAVRDWKSLSSGWVHRTFPDRGSFAWQPGYGAFTVSQSNSEAVRAYIARQEEHHRHMMFEDELCAFLERHGVSFDPDHLL